jgi:hypothetical protein
MGGSQAAEEAACSTSGREERGLTPPGARIAPGPLPGAAGVQNRQPTDTIPTKTVSVLAWVCSTCDAACVPIRSESRCICGHRLKEHKEGGPGEHRCSARGCACAGFFFIVAEGSWILRCACKHKHTEHDPASHKCAKPKCGCARFHSPWVCNCNHPWAHHKQVLVERQVGGPRWRGARVHAAACSPGGRGAARRLLRLACCARALAARRGLQRGCSSTSCRPLAKLLLRWHAQVADLQAMLQQPADTAPGGGAAAAALAAAAAAAAAAAGADGGLAPEVNRWDLIQRGQ